MKRKILVFVLVVMSCLACVIGVTACKTDRPSGEGGSSDVEVTGITISQTTLALEVGDSATLTATIAPNNATDKTVTWQSSDSTVAKVENGNVTALQAGKSTITATAGSKSATCQVTVTEKVIPHTHDLTLVPAKQADCETAGNTAYYTCACGKWFSDANAENEVTDKTSVTINATGHSYAPEWTYNETQHWHKTTCKHTTLISTPQNHTFENGVCSVCGYINDLIIFKTLEVNDDTVYGKVSNATTDFSFIKEVTANTNVTYTVSTDKACKDTIPSKTVDLKTGDNVFYVLAAMGNDIKLYTVTLRRRPIYTVMFDTDGGSAVAEQQVEEDNSITAPETEKTGHTFAEWTFNNESVTFPYFVTQDVTLKANFTANNYAATFDVNGGDELQQTSITFVYGQTLALPVASRTGYTFLGWFDGDVEEENTNWLYPQDKAYTARWQINTYSVSVSSNYPAVCELSGGGSFEYESAAELSTTANIGYDFIGWYIDDTKISEELRFNYTVRAENVVITARWEISSEFENFDFTSTLTSCNITGLKDKTVTSVIIPNSVTSIGDSAFQNCGGLTSAIIPDSVTSIGYRAFENCSGLTNVTIPDSVTSIGEYAFYDCNSIEEIRYTGDLANWCKINGLGGLMRYGGSNRALYIAEQEITGELTIPDSVTSIGDNAFQRCGGLTSIIISDGVTNIGKGVFQWCRGVKSVTIPNSVTTIGAYAFEDCCRMAFVIIPDSVTTIGGYAFFGCNLLTIYCEAAKMPKMWHSSWNYSGCPVVWGYGE